MAWKDWPLDEIAAMKIGEAREWLDAEPDEVIEFIGNALTKIEELEAENKKLREAKDV